MADPTVVQSETVIVTNALSFQFSFTFESSSGVMFFVDKHVSDGSEI